MSAAVFACRSCGSTDITPVLSLGTTPLANALLSDAQLSLEERRFPLDVVFCRACTLVQIEETVPPEDMFSEYFYFSSFSDTMLRHAEALVARTAEQRQLGPGSLAMEIASNDGYLLQYYKARGIPVLGIEPASNIAEVANQKGIATLNDFFGLAIAQTLRSEGRLADVMHGNNVLAHVPDLNGVVAGFRTVLKPNGRVIIEAPYVKAMIDHCEFDTIYHEHLSYFSLTALDQLFARHDLTIVDAELIAIHGGSLRITAAPTADAGVRTADSPVQRLLDQEAEWGVHREAFYADFGARVARLKADLRSLLAGLKAEGKRIAVYGASAKGSTLLNYFEIGGDTLDFVADRSTVKQGRFTPGTHLPIVAPEALLERQPDYVLLLSWNFADEILAQQAEYRARGGRFIVPIPELKVL